jgi:PleD family two-component response regulator
MGLAILSELPENLEDATKTADQLMYQSKSLGKSQTTIQSFI